MIMQKYTHTKKLLASLHILHVKLSMMIVQIRSRANQVFAQPKITFDVNLVLFKRIEELVASSASEQKKPHAETASHQQVESIGVNSDKHDTLTGNIHNVADIKTEFSKYIQDHNASKSVHPSMGEKLKTSAWEHIHSSIRLARLGDVNAAELHANIASHALDEAGHFLSHTEYSILAQEIEQYFADAQKEEH